MNFLANENIPFRSIEILRASGHDVTAVAEDFPGAADTEVLTRARSEERIILTFDRDYGELVFRLRLPVPAGVVYFRFVPLLPEEPAKRLLQVLGAPGIVLAGRFVVVERDTVRSRPLPA